MPKSELILLIPDLIQIAAMILLLTLSLFNSEKTEQASWLIAVLSVISSFGVIILFPALGTAFAGMIIIKKADLLYKQLFLITTFFFLLFSHRNIGKIKLLIPEYRFLTISSLVGLFLIVSSQNLFIIFIGIEILTLSFTGSLCLFKSIHKEVTFKFLILNLVASAVFILGLTYIYGYIGSFDISQIQLSTKKVVDNFVMLKTGNSLIILSLIYKFFVLNYQLISNSKQNMMLPSSAYFITIISILAGVVVLNKFIFWENLNSFEVKIVQFFAVLALFIGNLQLTGQRSWFKLLQSVALIHSGYILLLLTLGCFKLSFSYQLYLLAFIASFSGFSAFFIMLGGDGIIKVKLENLNNIFKYYPVAGSFFLIILLSMSCFPLTLGFWGSYSLFSSAIKSDLLILIVCIGLSSVVSASYYIRLGRRMFTTEIGKSFMYGKSLHHYLALGISLSIVLTVTCFPEFLLNTLKVWKI